jgi:hypothetical protein
MGPRLWPRWGLHRALIEPYRVLIGDIYEIGPSCTPQAICRQRFSYASRGLVMHAEVSYGDRGLVMQAEVL